MPVQGVPYSEGAGSHYGSRAGMENEYGSVDIAAYFDIDSDGDETKIANAIDYGLGIFDIYARQQFLQAEVAIPTAGSAYFEALAPIANEWTGAWGYFKRGSKENTGKPAGAMQKHMEHAEAALNDLIGIVKYGGAVASSPVAEPNTYWPTGRAGICGWPAYGGPICG